MSSPLRIWHPFSNSVLDPPPLHVTKAEGALLYTADGREIIDAISSWWVNLHGHANPRIAAAIAAQGKKLEHVILAGFTHDAAEELVARLRKWVPSELTHLFFSDDGSTAVEVGLKLAVQHFQNLSRPEKREIVALEQRPERCRSAMSRRSRSRSSRCGIQCIECIRRIATAARSA
jgi:adenosylmethionine-8-amino-7-oxononanoate aminotransferase